MTTPYRADHIGSLLRPPELLQARAAYDQGRLTLAQLRQSEDTAILQALELLTQLPILEFEDYNGVQQLIHLGYATRADLPDLLIGLAGKSRGGEITLTFEKGLSPTGLFEQL